MIGISGSGKSTAAKKYIGTFGGIIVSRDKLRELLFGYTEETVKHYYNRGDVKKYEEEVTRVEHLLIKDGLKHGDVVVDATHLKLQYINKLKKKFHYVNHVYHYCDTPLDLAISRDLGRKRIVGESIIRRQYEDLQNLKRNFNFSPYIADITPIVQDPNKPSCILVDLDGTLALHTSGRSPFDWKRVGEDSVNIPVLDLINTYSSSSTEIFIVSGRDSVCREECIKWLKDKGVFFQKLYMRPEKDQRPDYIIKEEIWREIAKDHYIEYIIDDRTQVVEHAVRLGLFVYDVNQTKEEF